ncbi:trypsin-like peptidase domain-containing protein [bacterium]|nr:trypsin-like peptidase domain-containing protein [bacterium]
MNYSIFLIFLSISIFANTQYTLPNKVTIVGEQLKESSDNYIVDLGFSIISIPKDKVLEQKSIESKVENMDIQKGSIFFENSSLERKTIKDNVEGLGHSVVMVNTPSGLGSGFIIHPDGYLVTNYHVIEGEKNLKITMYVKKDKEFEKTVFSKIKIVSINPFYDLALLKIEDAEKKLPFVYLGDVNSVKAGDTVFAIGTPLGLERSVSQGIVSLTNRNYNGLLYIQTTAPINPGNSGGPLFNLKGEVIGVTNMGYMFSDGLGFAIPIDYVKHFLLNRDAFYYNEHNYNTGFRYLEPPKKGAK